MNSTKEMNLFEEVRKEGGFSPMDSIELETQYVGGMADGRTCDESLYHRL